MSRLLRHDFFQDSHRFLIVHVSIAQPRKQSKELVFIVFMENIRILSMCIRGWVQKSWH